MKRLFLCLTLVLAACLNAAAQTNLIASLSHNDKLTAYYGEEALKEAYAAAQDGDVITLSSGTFSCPDTIRKAISLKGAGMMSIGESRSTIMKGTCNIKAQPKGKSIDIEGIVWDYVYVFGNGATDEVSFLKCKIYSMSTRNAFSKFIDCLITNHFYVDGYEKATQAYCTNCVLTWLQDQGNSSMTFDHCIIDGSFNSIKRMDVRNSVFVSRYSDAVIPSEASCINCVGVTNSENTTYNFFVNHNDQDNKMVFGFEDFFKTFMGLSPADGELFDLTDEAAAKYLGDDDSQVGIHGGSAPFDPLPSTAQVKKYGVKTAQDADGNIKVTINVE